jgi:hypothetical protein
LGAPGRGAPLFVRLVKLGDTGGASRRIATKRELGVQLAGRQGGSNLVGTCPEAGT